MLSRALSLTAFTAATLVLCVACTQSEADACGKGTVYRDGDCHPETVATGGSAAITTPAGNEAGAAGAGTEATDPNFGLDCSTNEDCQGVTNYCVPMSPFDTAYCSLQDCDSADPGGCPATWTCTDLSRFVAGLPWACTRPTN
jgi:hypothetical protein